MYTKSGKKRTTQEYLAIIILVGLAIYFVVKVILPLAFVLTTPVITIIALVNLIKLKDETYFKYSLICSALFIFDYLFNGYSSYLMADNSFIAENLYFYVGGAFVCFGLSLVLLFYNKLDQIQLKFKIENTNVRKSILAMLFFVLLTPFYFVENKFLQKSALYKPILVEKVATEKPNLDQPTVDNSSTKKSSIEEPNLEQVTAEKTNLEQSKIVQSNKFNKENGMYASYYDNGNIREKGNYVNGSKNGEWIEYRENGQIKKKENYVIQKLNGYPISKLHGEWISYYESGEISTKYNYVNGERNGECFNYYRSGKVMEKWDYVNSESWEYTTYYENGVIKEKINYVNGKRIE